MISKGDKLIGQRVKELRMKQNLTQKELAELVMGSPSSITRLETGQIMVSILYCFPTNILFCSLPMHENIA
ncbi:helix-turn-helix domain-containing protein [Hungatella effluvii]|uniref:helix-turn-helix domain-containing protein n=1 Tax=Hungatella effluvii TaxID=1096246 RepID=UPI003D80F116